MLVHTHIHKRAHSHHPCLVHQISYSGTNLFLQRKPPFLLQLRGMHQGEQLNCQAVRLRL